jgi:hypothetical protein
MYGRFDLCRAAERNQREPSNTCAGVRYYAEKRTAHIMPP